MYKRLLVPLVIITTAVCVQAQQGGRVYLGIVDGLVDGKIEVPGSPLTFHFYYENHDPVNKARQIKNPFELSATGRPRTSAQRRTRAWGCL